MIDLFSRFITGWMIADVDSGDLAKQLVEQTCAAWKIVPDTLTLHADKSISMNVRATKAYPPRYS